MIVMLWLLACGSPAPEPAPAVEDVVEADGPKMVPVAVPIEVTPLGGAPGTATTYTIPQGPPPLPAKALSSARTTFVVPDPSSPDGLKGVLLTEATRAAASGQTPFVQLYAEWCGPCRELRASMEDDRMLEAFEGTWILLLDMDVWRVALAGAGVDGGGVTVPAFYAVLPDGTLGESINGHAWGENTAANMAPVLQRYFRAAGVTPVSEN